MLNQYPLWKYLIIVAVIGAGFLYALPNLYGEDPALQISASGSAEVGQSTVTRVREVLRGNDIPFTRMASTENQALMVRFPNADAQLEAQTLLSRTLGTDYVVALSLAPATPGWLRALNAQPMYLGLDLRGGVHFLMEVDMDTVVSQAQERYVNDLRGLLRDERVRHLGVNATDEAAVEIKFRDEEQRAQAEALIDDEFDELELSTRSQDRAHYLVARIGEEPLNETKKLAVKQNITTLRNRVNELGVAEPVIQRQGESRIVVQLPGVQDTARAKEILGATATLEFRLVDESHDAQEAVSSGRVPAGSRLYYERNGDPILLKPRVIVTGDSIVDAASGFDQQTGSPNVNITLDGQGARAMHNVTKDNVGRLMGVVFIEHKPRQKQVDGETKRVKEKVEEVINVARIREPLSKRFQITGLGSPDEARDLALLLRAGALSAPIDIIEERTVGPSMGQDNIEQGTWAVVIGFILVVVFMGLYYRVFGLVANVALLLNLVLIVAALSLMQATLTLPGIAGIVLTVGMAVDANVLIFQRIREEIKAGNSPQASIHTGYARALSTIADANITTLIAAVVLFAFGTGPIKGFAVTLSLGIMSSMFTAIMVSRGIINLIYGGRRVERLAI